jgi:hypothetical protein
MGIYPYLQLNNNLLTFDFFYPYWLHGNQKPTSRISEQGEYELFAVLQGLFLAPAICLANPEWKNQVTQIFPSGQNPKGNQGQNSGI